MIIASIDIGSNTIILLIAKYNEQLQELFSIYNAHYIPRISEGLILDGEIKTEAIHELLNNLEEFYKSIKQNQADIVLVNATNAMRIAGNSNVIKDRIKKQFNWDVNIISGEREAELTFLGIASPNINSNEEIITIDIGGGSTEICFGRQNKIQFRKSYNLGIVSLSNQYICNDPPTGEEIIKIRETIRTTFCGIENKFPNKTKTIAVAGTPTTLASILVNANSYEDELIENVELSREYLSNFIIQITGLQSLKVLDLYGNLVKGREDLILIGSIILEEFLMLNKIDKVQVSAKGLRYGAIWDYLIKNNKYNPKNG